MGSRNQKILLTWLCFFFAPLLNADVFYARFSPEDCDFLGHEPREQLFETPFIDAHDAYVRLYCMAQELQKSPIRDDRIVFLTMYLRTTDAVVSAIEAEEFIDNPWVDAYLTSFADLYRSALFNFEKGRLNQVPWAWRLAFEACKDANTLISQHLLLGVNAHVNYDLAMALSGLDLKGKGRYEDHTRINAILESIVDEQFELVAEKYARGLGKIPKFVDKLSKQLFFINLQVGREGAWKKAILLQNSTSPAWRDTLRRGIDAEGLALAQLGLSPNLSPAIMKALHKIEQGQL